jgi:hypothetical protein
MTPKFVKWKPFRDLTGLRFGRLRVLAFSKFTDKDHRSEFLYICDCGKVGKRLGCELVRGVANQSCGCARSLVGKPWSISRRQAFESGKHVKTHCKNGHLRSAANLTTGRACRICANSRRRKSSEPVLSH